MYRFGKAQQKSSVMREAEIPRIPTASDLRNLLAKAQRNSQNSLELPFYTSDSPIKLALVVKCEQYGKSAAFWTLYRTDAPGSPALWTQQASEIDLIHNLLELGYGTAAESQKQELLRAESGEPEIAPAPIPIADPPKPVPGRRSGGKTAEVNPYLVQLEASGKFISEKAPTPPEDTKPVESPPEEDDDPFYQEALRGLTMSDEELAEQAEAIRKAEIEADRKAEIEESLKAADLEQPGKTPEDKAAESQTWAEPGVQAISFDEALTQSKERKQQAVTAAILKLSSGDLIACRAEIVDAVRLVVNPFDTGNSCSSTSEMVDRDLKALASKFGDKKVLSSLTETFTAILKGKSVPTQSEIEIVTSRWFF